MSTNTSVVSRQKLSIKIQLLATIVAIATAVGLPQIFHVWGKMAGIGTSLGEIFLPMHLPVIAVGFLAGPAVGLATGIISPILSSALTGMPTSVMLPFMTIELAVYGLTAGALKDVKLPLILKVLIAQVMGRLIRAAAILISVNMLGNTKIHTAMITKSIGKGIFGLFLQWTIIPLFVFWVMKMSEKEE